MKTIIVTDDGQQTNIVSPVPFVDMVAASQQGGFIELVAIESVQYEGQVWQGYKYEGTTEIIVTHYEDES